MKIHGAIVLHTGYLGFFFKKYPFLETQAVSSMNGKVIYGTRIMVTFAPWNAKTSICSSSTARNDDLGLPTRQNRGDGDMGGNRRSLLEMKDLANVLAQKGHPVNINDIGLFSSSSTVNRNSRYVLKKKKKRTNDSFVVPLACT